MNTENDPLRKVLSTWRDIEASQDFDEAVWHRIESEPARATSPLRGFIELFTAHPAWAACAGAAAGLVIGLALAGRPMAAPDQFALLSSDSLAGSYIHVATGETP